MMKAVKWILSCGILLAATGIVLGGCGRAKADKTEIWEVWKDSLDKQELMPVSAESVRGLIIETQGIEKFAVAYEPREGKDSYDYWNITKPYQSYAVADTEKLYNLFESAEALIAQMICTDIEDEAQAVTLNSAGQTKISLAFLENHQKGVKAGAKPDSILTLTVNGENKEQGYIISVDGQDGQYLAPKALVDDLININPFAYILKVPFLVNKDTVREVEVVIEGNTYCMSSKDGKYFLGNKTVEEDTYNKLYNQLLSVLIKEEIDQEPDPKAEKQSLLSLRFIRNLEGAPNYEVTFWSYDQNLDGININGKTFFLADHKDVMNLVQVIKKYFEN